jgi:hypothetical protein
MATNIKPDIGSTYRTGAISPVSGKFTCTDCEKAGKDHKVDVKEGKAFPDCEKMAVTWRLDKYA